MLNRMLKLVFLGSILIPGAAVSPPLLCKNQENEKCVGESTWNPCGDNFDLIHGKASTATTLWLLGARHSLQDKTNECIEHLTKKHKKHHIYLESLPPGKVSCKKWGIKEKPGRECFGWDDMESEKNAGSLLGNTGIEVEVGMLQSVYTEEHLSDSRMDTFLKKLSQSKLITKEAANLLLTQRKSGDTYAKIFSQKDKFLGTELTPAQVAKFKSYNKKRNQSLLRILEEAPTNVFKVVSIGKAHVVKHPEDTGAAEYLLKELDKGKHQNYYAVLATR